MCHCRAVMSNQNERLVRETQEALLSYVNKDQSALGQWAQASAMAGPLLADMAAAAADTVIHVMTPVIEVSIHLREFTGRIYSFETPTPHI